MIKFNKKNDEEIYTKEINNEENSNDNNKIINSKKILKIILDKLLLLGIALTIMGIFAGIAWYVVTADLREIEKKNRLDPVYLKYKDEIVEKEKAEKEKQKKLDKINEKKQAEKKAIAKFEKSVKGKYTKDELLRICSSDRKLAERLHVIGGYDCMYYCYASHDWDDDICYDELSYYVFKNERNAKKAFNIMKEKWIDRETDSGKNYVQGWESGVLDAEVEVFIYQTDNMIIAAELKVVSGWAEPENGEDGNSSVNFYYRKKFIQDRF